MQIEAEQNQTAIDNILPTFVLGLGPEEWSEPVGECIALFSAIDNAFGALVPKAAL